MFSLLLFISIPILEIYLLVAVGKEIGALPTIGLIILNAFIGIAVLRKQSISLVQRLQNQLQQGETPAQALLESLILLLSGVLLLIPGFFTDTLSLIGLIPWTRRQLAHYFHRRLHMNILHAYNTKPPTPNPNTLEGEYTREN